MDRRVINEANYKLIVLIDNRGRVQMLTELSNPRIRDLLRELFELLEELSVPPPPRQNPIGKSK
jgi:hypothetical protein